MTTSFDLTGKILMAMPGMPDPRFSNSVILLCAHSEEGAMGLMINKLAENVSKEDLFDQLGLTGQAEALESAVHTGGPVEMERGFVLHTADYESAISSLSVGDGLKMTATLDILEDIASGDGPEHAMLALGYCGWGAGQLEGEIAENGWLVGDAETNLIFGQDDAQKWCKALAAQGLDPVLLSDVAGRA